MRPSAGGRTVRFIAGIPDPKLAEMLTSNFENREPIRFNKPCLEGDELEHLAAAVKSGIGSAKGPYSEQVGAILRDELGARDVLLTTSCTAALELAAMLLRLEPGDNVIVPSFTFVTTASAFAREGAALRFADIEPDRLGIDPASVATLIDERTRAVVPVHYAGIPVDLDGLATVLADWPQAEIVEDNAHGLFSRHRGQPLGSFGRFSTLSFHETKNFVCGEGGALVVNRPEDVDRAHVLYDKGTNRRAFLAGQVDKYSWVDQGSSFGLSDLLAAYLLGQLERRDVILAKRRAVFEGYLAALTPHQERLGFRVPDIPADCVQGYHMFYVLVSDHERRTKVLDAMRARGVMGTFHYVPLHSAAGAQFTDRATPCPVTDEVSGCLIRLPFFNDLGRRDLERVVSAFLEAAERS